MMAVGDHQHARASERGRRCRARGASGGLLVEAYAEPERAAAACCALHTQLTTHQVDQAAGDGQAEAGATEIAARRPVDLLERLEQQVLCLGCDADARIL